MSKCVDDELTTGWLAPDGSFYPCHSYDHIAKARALTGKKSYSDCSRPDQLLMDAGYAYVGISSFFCHEWRIGWNKFLTDYQINFLRPYFEESNIRMDEMSLLRWKREVEGELDYEN